MTQRRRPWTLLLALALLLVAAAPALAQQTPGQQTPAREAAPEAGWSPFFYFFAPGSVFRPRDSDVAWHYDGYGCISIPAGAIDYFTLHLDLPPGARIDYLRLFFYDNSASNSWAWISRYDAEGTVEDLVYAGSSGSGGYDSTLSAYYGGTVDNTNWGYMVQWVPGAAGSSLQLCGVRVAYRLALDEVFLPLIVKS